MVGVWRVDHSDSNASQRRNDHIIPAWCVDAKATKGNSYALTKFRLMRASKEVRVCWLGRVYVAPINALFFGVWRVVRLFLREETVAKFALLRGKNWRARLQDALGPGVALPEHMRPPAS